MADPKYIYAKGRDGNFWKKVYWCMFLKWIHTKLKRILSLSSVLCILFNILFYSENLRKGIRVANIGINAYKKKPWKKITKILIKCHNSLNCSIHWTYTLPYIKRQVFINSIFSVRLLIFCFMSNARIFHSSGNVTITMQWKASNLTFAPHFMAIEQWGFLSVPHLLWHRASVYNGHLQGPVTLTPVAVVWQLSFHCLF